MSEIYENDWKFTRKKNILTRIFLVIIGPFFTILILTEYPFLNPPIVDKPLSQKILSIIVVSVMHPMIIFLASLPVIGYIYYQKDMKYRFVEKYKITNSYLIWISPLGTRNKIDISDIFCILYPSGKKGFNKVDYGVVYYDTHENFFYRKKHEIIYFDKMNGFNIKEEYIIRCQQCDLKCPAVITDEGKESIAAETAFKKGKIGEYKKEFWSKHSLDEF